MPKTDNPHAVRLYQSILKNANQEMAERIANKIPLSKSADYVKKFAWAESICSDLESEFDDITVKKIRMNCACGPENGKMEKLRKVYIQSADIEEFVDKANRLNLGFSVEMQGGDMFLIYPECYCSCVKRVEAEISRTWCYCTLGYTKRMFEYIFEKEVHVELVESVKSGGEKCKIKIIFLK